MPNLRFPEFTDEWKESELQDISKISKGSGISKDQLSEKGTPCILYGELYTKYKSEIISEVLSKTEINEKNLVHSRKNDIIIPSSGETAIDISTARYIPFDDIFIGGDLNIIRLHDQDGRFFSYQLNGVRKLDIAKIAQGVSVVHLYGENLKKLKVKFPSIKEQNKISSLLTLIDERIVTQSKIIEDLEKLKSAISKKVFTNLFTNHIVKLGDICLITTGRLDANAMTEEGQYMFFTCSKENYRTISFAFDGEALLIAGNGEIGNVKYYDGKFNAYQRTYVLQQFTENIKYLQFYIEYHLPKRVIKEKNVGAMPYIVLSTLANMPIRLPSVTMQNNISQSLELIENKIKIENTNLTLYVQQKQYLLRHLFI